MTDPTPFLHRRWPALADTLPHERLGTGPTPVRELQPGIWVKDEGAYGDGGWGGNKVRKLEWILADARRQGRGTVLTFGAVGTNHGLATALYAPQAGLKAAVAVVDQPLDDHVRANFARLKASGATVHETHTAWRTTLLVPYLLLRHRRPYVLPAGGSSPVGVLGYVEAALELAAQIDTGVLPRPGTVVCAIGTGGTLAGTTLGLRLAGLGDVRVEGVLVNDQLPLDAGRIARLAQKTAALLARRGADVPPETIPQAADIVIATDALGAGYGHATEEGLAAVALGPGLGLPIEPVYTGKALGRLLRVHAAGGYGERPVLFLQTNGPRS
ncbi:MAG: Pyridoxal-5-phosphate-dependent protein beta subunit [Solirubrobacterales bacterium]|nr:Pyridoxal-5-phosphate-dependent protein beta subunit [Solirubrobacterales bacterium]